MKHAIALTAFLIGTVALGEAPVPPINYRSVERKDREVDTAALDAMKVGARRLIALAEKKKDTRQEKDILINLVESLQKITSVEFRLAYGPGGKELAGRAAEYKQSLSNTVRATDRLMARYPNDPYIPKAYLIHGRSSKDLGDRARAEKDFTYVANKWANTEAGALAMLSLCDLLVEEREYGKAIVYLNQLEARPNKPFHAMVLEHLAWAHFYQNDIVSALRYNEKRIAFHDQQKALSKSDLSDADSATMNAALFYSKMIEKKTPGITVASAMPYFKTVFRGARFGKVLVRFAFHIRTNNLDAELEEWERIVAGEPTARNEAVEILLVTLENQVNRRRFAQLKNTMDQFPILLGRAGKIDPSSKNAEKARLSLLLAASAIQGVIVERKNAPDALVFVDMLRGVFVQILAMSDPRDKSVPKLHFNLAELNFEYKNFAAAEKHYRWIVDNARLLTKEDSQLPGRAWVSAISARYEILRQKNYIPKELKARSMADGKAVMVQDPELLEWFQWLSLTDYAKSAGDALDVFHFEANRALYAQNQYVEAISRMKEFVDKKPHSQYAVPSASLVLDTYIATNDWEKAYEYSKYLSDMGFAHGSEFSKRLVGVTTDTYFKMIESLYQKKSYALVLAKVDDFIKRHPNTKKMGDTLSIAGNAALGLGDKKRAMLYLGQAMDHSPSSEMKATTLATRASLAEDQYDVEIAAKTYRVYLENSKGTLKGDELTDVRRKILFLTFLSGRLSDLKEVVRSTSVCTSEVADDCERYEAFISLYEDGGKRGGDTARKALGRSQKTRSAAVVWATLAMENIKSFGLKERLSLVDAVAQLWTKSDAVTKYALLPYISESLPAAIELSRNEIRKAAPLNKIQKDLIDRRSGMMQSLEEVGSRVAALPWGRIRAAVSNEMANMYFEFGRDLNRLPVPEGLAAPDLADYKKTIAEMIAPFEKKAQDFRKSAFDIASLSTIDESNLKSVSAAFFAENGALSKELRKGWSAEGIRPISLSLLRKVDPTGGWESGTVRSDDPTVILKTRMGQALSRRNFPLVSFLLNEMNSKKALPTPLLKLVKAVSFSTAGAQAEGVTELQDAVASFSRDQREPIYVSLVSHYYAAFDKEKTLSSLKEYFAGKFDATSETDRIMIVSAARWAGIDPPSELNSYRAVAGKRGGRE